MATAPLPSRTRSIRKPNAGIDLKSRSNGLNSEQAPDAPGGRSRSGDVLDSARTASQSPSKLPMRPPSSSSSTSRLTRAGSLSYRAAPTGSQPGSKDGSMRPPRSVTTRPPLSSQPGASDGSMRPPRSQATTVFRQP
ncbi:hypothetical protein V491_06498 [Pseudogymnoascus sp. VKM F-3775]|nr:hypothetical protein V491_06498 [Pseudogymnoascus sp. VKM F-3775]